MATKATKAKETAKEAKAKATETPKPTAADLGAQLNDLLNKTTKQTATCGTVTAPAKKSVSRANFTGELLISNPAGGILCALPVKTYVATEVEKFERSMFHGNHVVMQDELDAELKPTGNKVPVMIDEIVDGKPTGNKIPKTETCLGNLKQGAMTCSDCGTTVEKSAAQKGVRMGDKVIFISDDELKAQQPMSDKKMKVLEYVDLNAIDPIYFESAEYLVPEGSKVVMQQFFAFVGGLQDKKKVAKGVRVKGGREQYFILRPNADGGLTMHHLFAEHEVRTCDKWAPVAVEANVRALFGSLIEATAVPSFTAAPQDTYLANVNRLKEQKAAGVAVEVPVQDVAEVAATDLASALEAALNAAKAKKAVAAK